MCATVMERRLPLAWWERHKSAKRWDCSLPLTAEGVTADAMYEDLFHDKKTLGGRIHWVLAEGIGKVSVHSDVPEEIVRKTLLGLSS